jgi:hypothetical protein
LLAREVKGRADSAWGARGVRVWFENLAYGVKLAAEYAVARGLESRNERSVGVSLGRKGWSPRSWWQAGKVETFGEEYGLVNHQGNGRCFLASRPNTIRRVGGGERVSRLAQ